MQLSNSYLDHCTPNPESYDFACCLQLDTGRHCPAYVLRDRASSCDTACLVSYPQLSCIVTCCLGITDPSLSVRPVSSHLLVETSLNTRTSHSVSSTTMNVVVLSAMAAISPYLVDASPPWAGSSTQSTLFAHFVSSNWTRELSRRAMTNRTAIHVSSSCSVRKWTEMIKGVFQKSTDRLNFRYWRVVSWSSGMFCSFFCWEWLLEPCRRRSDWMNV